MPSQKQLRWSELRVGITVIVASITLAVLIFLMSGSGGMFTSKITLYAYFDNAEGLRQGQPVDLNGVAIGNVKTVQVVPGKPDTPVQVTLRINKQFQPYLRTDSTATVKTAGVLGESFIDIDSRGAKLGIVKDGDTLKAGSAPDLGDVVRASQGTLQNLDTLIKRLDRIVAEVESGKGTLGQVINDPTMMNKINAILNEAQGLLNSVKNGDGTIGQLFTDKTLYKKLDDVVDKLSKVADDANAGKGTLGKLLKDESLYNNANQAISKVNKTMDDVNAGRGTLGKLTKDEAMAKKLENSIDKLSAILDRLNAGEGSAGMFLKDPAFYNNTDQLLIESRTLVKAIRENPKKYLTIHFRIF